MTALLFVHGGAENAYSFDKKIVDRLQPLLGGGHRLRFPHMKGLEDLDWSATAKALRAQVEDLPPHSIVVAHSVGAAAMIKLLSEGTQPSLRHLFLLAAPYNGKDGEWGDTDFGFAADFAAHLPKHLPITLFHSDDDKTIPVDSARHYARAMPTAKVQILHGYGHQFVGSLDFLADAIKAAAE